MKMWRIDGEDVHKASIFDGETPALFQTFPAEHRFFSIQRLKGVGPAEKSAKVAKRARIYGAPI
jgi:hypothetical protein